MLTVGRPTRDDVGGRVESKLLRLAALRGNEIHVVVAVPIGGKCDGAAVGTEHRPNVVGNVPGQLPGGAADTFDHPDIAQVTESDELAVRRDVGGPGKADRFLSASRNRQKEDNKGCNKAMLEKPHDNILVRQVEHLDKDPHKHLLSPVYQLIRAKAKHYQLPDCDSPGSVSSRTGGLSPLYLLYIP